MNKLLVAAFLSLEAGLDTKAATTRGARVLIGLELAENGKKVLKLNETAVKTLLSEEEDAALIEGGYYLNDGEVEERSLGTTADTAWFFTIAWEALEADVDDIKYSTAEQVGESAALAAKNRELKRVYKELGEAQNFERVLRQVEANMARVGARVFKAAPKVNPPKLRAGGDPNRALAGVPTLMVSDLHYGEVVNAEQVMGMNEYNIEIADIRLKRVFEKMMELCFTHMSGTWYEGAVVVFGGDMVSGMIHEELARTNDAAITDCVMQLAAGLVNGLRAMADQFGSVYVPCVVGNHGRLEQQKVAKGKVRENFDYLVYKIVKGSVSNDPRITVDISPAADLTYRVYNTGFLLTHGDQVKSQGGVGGIWPSLMKADYRKRMISQYRGKMGMANTQHDYLILGHFHQYGAVENIIVNGSLKGVDEYAFLLGCKPEVARQALWFTHPLYGITSHMPVIAQDMVMEQEVPPVTPMIGMTSL